MSLWILGRAPIKWHIWPIRALWALSHAVCLWTVMHIFGHMPCAWASGSENPQIYDSRVVAMGGAGVALETQAAAGVANPAALSDIKQRAVTLSVTPFILHMRAPFIFSNRSVRSIESGTLFGPFTQLGVGSRLSKRFTLGMLGFVTQAAGGAFNKIPLNSLPNSPAPKGLVGSAVVGQIAGELQVPVAFEVNDRLSVALAYRITHVFASALLKNFGGVPMNEASLSGTNFLGVGLGVLHRPLKQLRLGLSYRSQVKIDMVGTQKTLGVQSDPVALNHTQAYASPHQLRLGAAYQPFCGDLLIALEGRAWLYHLADKLQRNTGGAAVGVEYKFLQRIFGRAGYSVSLLPTPDTQATPFAAPPGIGHAVTAGAGIKAKDWRFDAAVGYVITGKTVSDAKVNGRYQVDGLITSVDVAYEL